MRLPVGLVGDGKAGQAGAVIIHNVVGPVSRTHDLQETQKWSGSENCRFCLIKMVQTGLSPNRFNLKTNMF